MTYIERISALLRPKTEESPFTAIDLYSGCGGLSLGFEANGFKTIAYEMNKDACDTYRTNLTGQCHNEIITPETEFPDADILIAGPPCQPFSVGGNQLGRADFRNGFPSCIAAVRKIRPKVFVFENVKGLLYKNKWYLDQVLSELKALDYNVGVKLLNSKHFDVPQNRERLFIVGTEQEEFVFPTGGKHTITAGEALGTLALQAPEGSKFLTDNMDSFIARYERASQCTTARNLHLNRPARTLTCRNLAGSTGDMQRIELPDGRRRRLLAVEAARLQSFPNWFVFSGSMTSVFNQIGNAVPPMAAFYMAECVKRHMEKVYSDNAAATSGNGDVSRL